MGAGASGKHSLTGLASNQQIADTRNNSCIPTQVKIYEDEDGARKEEIAALANKDNPFAAFYDRLKEIREYHRRFPNLDVTEVGDGNGEPVNQC
eukprot:1153480-Pelagomonas_calceolata.AAC.3